jgi:tellurite resistance protein
MSMSTAPTDSTVSPSASLESALQPAKPLVYLPIGMFGAVMSLTGLSVAWRMAHSHFDAPTWISSTIGGLAIVTFVALSIGYLIKWIAAPEAVRSEYHHPILGNLFGTFFISLLLLPIVIAPFNLVTAQCMWAIGAVGMTLFAWSIVTRWLSERQQLAHATPAWIIPVVGMLDVPLALPSLDLPPMHGVMVMSLAIGLFFAIPLFTSIFMRLLFEPPMPDALAPTLLILVAPFAVGMSTYVVTTGQVDTFTQSLYAVALFVLAALLGRLRKLVGCCPFKVSWWAVGFPLAATSIAALRIATAEPGIVTNSLAVACLTLASLTIIGLLARTSIGLVRRELRVLSN